MTETAATGLRAGLAVLLIAASLGAAHAENIRGAATGPAKAPGFSHPEQYIHLKDVKPADNMYPVIQHPEQDKAAQDKLASLAAKTGKKPNIMIFLLDDVGWSDPGFNGGGVAVGNATPNMDRLANEGMILTSAYSTPSCSPTRATIHTGQNPLHHGILRPPMFPSPAATPNPDGSTTVYFGPSKPDGVADGDWIETVPSKGWFTILRLYSPLEILLHEGVAAKRDRAGRRQIAAASNKGGRR